MQSKNTKRAIASYAMVAALVLSAMGTPVKAVGQWEETNGTWKYTNEGKQISGWKNIGGCWYAFNVDGSMKTGWIASDEKWYFMGQSGVMQDTGWVTYLGTDYYLKGTGIMATDFIKDGYELDSTGKAIPMTQTKSVELTEQMDINNKTIEGNLYLDATKYKELELSGITVTGKIVIIGDDSNDSKITIKDSTVNTISSQTRGAEVTLVGTTTVKSIQIEENSSIKPGEDYTGKVESVEIQSTAQNEVKIEVPAKTVTSNTFAPVTVEAKIDSLAVNKKTHLTVNADIKNITVNKTATDTKVEVSKGNAVGTIETEVKVEVGGSGNVNKVIGAGKDESIVTTETEKPSGGGGNSNPTPPVVNVAEVKTADEFLLAMTNDTYSKIVLLNDIEADMTKFNTFIENDKIPGTGKAEINNSKFIDLNQKTLNLLEKVLIRFTKDGANVQFRNGTINAMNFDENGTKSLFTTVGENITFTLDNVILNTNSSGIIPDGNKNILNIKNSTINCGVYAINTNANIPGDLTVNIDNSHLLTSNSSKDNSTILFNIPGSLNISNSTLTGNRHGLIIRGGTAVVSNTTITYNGGYGKPLQYYTTKWGGGNELPSAPVVIGNVYRGNSYLYPSNVEFNNVKIINAVKEVSEAINGTQIVIASNPLYTGDEAKVKTSFEPKKEYKVHTIILENLLEEKLHKHVTEAISELIKPDFATYEVSPKENVITTTFTDGEKTIKDLMGSGLFKQLELLKTKGVSDMKVGKTSFMTGDQETNAKNLLTIFAGILGNVSNENVLIQQVSSLNGKSLAIEITFAPKNQESIKETYTLKFVCQQQESLALDSVAEDALLSGPEHIVTPLSDVSLPVEEV